MTDDGRIYYADPALVAFDNRYYIYPTTDGTPDWSAIDFRVLSSADMRSWREEGVILRLGEDVSWADKHAWAPAAAEKNGLYYFYFTADDNIGVAVGSSPVGPFIDSGQPLIARGAYPGRAIDPSVFCDDDGTRYLVWGNGVANVARLDDDMLGIDAGSLVSWTDPTFREAAQIHRRGSLYYLTWSENDTREPEYRVRWAVGHSAVGPWSHRGILLEQRPAAGIVATGHHSILRIPDTDEWVIAYHRFAIPDGDGTRREVVIDPLLYSDEGDLLPVSPSLSPIHITSTPSIPIHL